MNAEPSARRRRDTRSLYLQLSLLLITTFIAGDLGIGVIRYGFIAGCGVLGYRAWKMGPAKHLEITIVLFIWAPFLRRVIDFSAGFDASGFILLGPVIGLLPPCADLYRWLVTGTLRRSTRMLGPYLLMALCLLYGFTVSVATGDVLPGLLGLTKFLPGMIYGLWLIARGGEVPNVIDGAARGFAIALPAAGIYGIFQFFWLPGWDSYWMIMTSPISLSQGLPLPGQVRVFGPMNSAASFGQYMVAGLLLLGFVRKGWTSAALCLPIIASLLLSSYRTGWIGLILGVAYCWSQGSTRRRAELIILWLVLGTVAILVLTPFGPLVVDRMASFAAPSDDGSGRERLAEYRLIMDHAQQLIMGLGIGGLGPFGNLKPRVTLALTQIIDGGVLDSIMLMGFIAGSLYLVCLAWAALQALQVAHRSRDYRLVAAGSIVVANLSAIPLASITRGEVSIIFWAMLGLLGAGSRDAATRASAVTRPLSAVLQS